MQQPYKSSHTAALAIQSAIEQHNGWLPFDIFMQLALYHPVHGYYSKPTPKLGQLPSDGSDFVTAPEMSPVYGQCLARAVDAMLEAADADAVLELGAGSGALAAGVLQHSQRVKRYDILEVSGGLRARQQTALQAHGGRVRWLDALPAGFVGVVLANEVLDAVPVKLLARNNGAWHERGVVIHNNGTDGALQFADRPTDLRPPADVLAGLADVGDYVTEIHPQAEALVRSVAECMERGFALWVDYGFNEAMYYHAQRHMGTLVCHHQHRVDSNPLAQVGEKDITAHVNFTGVAVAAQDAGMNVDAYSNQARFLYNHGFLEAVAPLDVAQRAMAMRLVQEHEMGELFQVLALSKNVDAAVPSLMQGDKSHTL